MPTVNESIRREEEIFTQACALPAKERTAYLQCVCAEEPALLQRVAWLLGAAEQAGAFLEIPPALAGPEVSGPAAGVDVPGKQIGHYILGRKLGEGGAGVVYEAEQTEPIQRRVALKVMKPGTDTEAAIVRFETERQVLALMEHPGIAQVFDAGTAENGRLYFVMELVRGERITRFCDRHRLGTAERLRLFIKVCQAVQHAHQKGVIHRDLKPGNILVGCPEGAPLSGAMPKIIDFGIAKAVQGSLGESTQVTALEQLIGTPAYMSPEQAIFGARDVDTRADIYSLGVLLYELLAGLTPFDTRELLSSGLDAVQRAIRERQPARPSTRIGGASSDERDTIASNRGVDPRRLELALRGDLDWIALKAMEKDRNRRYASAAEFASDIERHLREEPVLARPPGAWYFFCKFARRNRGAVCMLAGVFLALGVGLVIALAGYRRAASAGVAALAARDEAEEVTRFFTDILHQAHPWVGGAQRDLSVRDVLDAAAASVEQKFAGRPAPEIRIRATIADTYHGLTLYDQASEHAREALELARRLHGPDSPDTLHLLVKLADLEHYRGHPVLSERLVRDALAAYSRHGDDAHGERINALGVLATSLTWQGRMGPALAVAEERMALAARVLADDDGAWFDLRRELAYHACNAGRCMEARRLFDDILAHAPRAREPQERARLLFEAATNEEVIGNFVRAAELAREASELGDRWFGPDYTETIFPHVTLAHALACLGRAGEGLEEAETAAATLRARLGQSHLYTVRTDANLAFALSQSGRHADAERCAAVSEQWMRANVVFGLYGAAEQAVVLGRVGRAAEGEALCRAVLEGCQSLDWRDEYRLAAVERGLAAAIAAQGRTEEAAVLLRQLHDRLSAYGEPMADQCRLTGQALARLETMR